MSKDPVLLRVVVVDRGDRCEARLTGSPIEGGGALHKRLTALLAAQQLIGNAVMDIEQAIHGAVTGDGSHLND